MKNSQGSLVSVIVVTAGAKNYLARCLNSLMIQSYPNLEIIVMDNSRNANLVNEIRRSFPLVKLYSNQENLYYGAALNQGISLSQGEFILCLNDDVVLDEKFIQEALGGFRVNRNIGLVSGKIHE